MTITVNGPEGVQVNFPDGTDPDTIDQVMRDNFKPKEPTWGDRIQQGAQFVDNIVRRLASGATLGLADEAAAGMNTLTGRGGDKTYDQNLADERGRDSKFFQDHPVVATGAELAGGFLGPAAALAKGVGAATANLPRYVGYGLQGGALGAAYGAGNAEGGPEQRAKGALTGGALGAATGVALPAIAEGAGKAAGYVSRAVIDRMPGNKGSAAERALAQALEQDSMEAGTRAATKLDQLGPQGMIADLGPNTRGLADAVANAPGKGQDVAERALTTRQEGQGGRLLQSVQDALGGGKFHDTAEELFQARSQAAQPLYDAAFDTVKAVSGPRIDQFLKDPIIQSGIKKGLEIERLNSLAENRPMDLGNYGVVDFNEAGDPVLGRQTPLRLLDAAKKGLDDILENYRDKTTGRLVLDQRGRAIDAVRKSLVNELDDVTTIDGASLYKQARDAWAGPSKVLDALNAGRSFLRKDSEVTQKAMGSMSDSEKEAFRVGVARQLEDTVRNAPDGANAAKRIWRSDQMREKLRNVFPDQSSWNNFKQAMTAEIRMAETKQSVLGNSATAKRLAAREELGADIPGAVINAARGNVSGAVSGFVRGGMNWLNRPSQGISEELAPMLFSTDPAVKRAALAAALAKGQQMGMTRQKALLLDALLARAGGQGSGMAAGSAFTTGGSNQYP